MLNKLFTNNSYLKRMKKPYISNKIPTNAHPNKTIVTPKMKKQVPFILCF